MLYEITLFVLQGPNGARGNADSVSQSDIRCDDPNAALPTSAFHFKINYVR
jgi:hypothetical protein